MKTNLEMLETLFNEAKSQLEKARAAEGLHNNKLYVVEGSKFNGLLQSIMMEASLLMKDMSMELAESTVPDSAKDDANPFLAFAKGLAGKKFD